MRTNKRPFAAPDTGSFLTIQQHTNIQMLLQQDLITTESNHREISLNNMEEGQRGTGWGREGIYIDPLETKRLK